ncbi:MULTISPECIES: EVE domain-containing protein [Cyanophyceae]|uniref:EVE domain-containing protein n=1 Tax=Leptolyngbya subtilissima DQ-A4 TaxID=2933933 RepID=A0ABV0KBI7_9CYAN|nr:EVE domain-containing protein [Nodosilinea sp. FACHB-141]MBD2114932.1 EVE domain-containing protein [Nodosilinea sp. FACHB-141]
MAYWLFQGNPKYYRIIDGIRDFTQMPWLVTRYAKEMQPGDGVLIWISGKEAGLYAIADIIEVPKLMADLPDIGYWLDKSRLGEKPFATIRFTDKLLDRPLLRSELKQDPVLSTLIVIRQPNSTNFKVTTEEWQRVYELRQGA